LKKKRKIVYPVHEEYNFSSESSDRDLANALLSLRETSSFHNVISSSSNNTETSSTGSSKTAAKGGNIARGKYKCRMCGAVKVKLTFPHKLFVYF
jgi:hypothetical protein